MFESIGWAEILVLALIGLFILGPERLPAAIAWVASTMRTVRDFATGAKEQLRSELGTELDEFRKPLEDLRSIRDMNPRATVKRTLLEPVSDGTWSGAGTPAAPAATTAAGAAAGAAAGGAGTNGTSNGTSNGTAGGSGDAGSNGAHGLPASGSGGVVKGQSDRAQPLSPGEAAPFDPDAT